MENEYMVDSEVKEQDLTPQEYFNIIKERKHSITDEELLTVYDNCLDLLNKYVITGQKRGIQKLIFHLESIEKEREIVKLGINTFVYRDDIEYYIENVADSVVKIVNIEGYEREIPDDIVDVIALIKNKFDQLYIIYTDYTGRDERRVDKERKEKDPILFGAFQDLKTRSVIDRFYYIGDWVDEYCDLTLDRMVNEMESKSNKNIVHTIKTPKDIQELKSQLADLVRKDDRFVVADDNKKKNGIVHKVKTFLNKKK